MIVEIRRAKPGKREIKRVEPGGEKIQARGNARGVKRPRFFKLPVFSPTSIFFGRFFTEGAFAEERDETLSLMYLFKQAIK